MEQLPTEEEYAEMQKELEAQGWVPVREKKLMTHPDRPNIYKSLLTELMLRKRSKQCNRP